METTDSGGTTQEPPKLVTSSDKRQDPLERARIRAIYAVLGLIVVLALASVSGFAPHLDLGVFATLMGGLVSLLGLGAVIRLVGPR